MKKMIVFFCAVFFFTQSSFAQNNQNFLLRDYLERSGKDPWNVNISFEENVYFGEGDSKRPFGKRLSPSFAISGTRIASPIVSFRGMITYGSIYGWHTGNGSNLSNPGTGFESFNLTTAQLHALFNLTEAFGSFDAVRNYELMAFIGTGGAFPTKNGKNNREILWSLGVVNTFYLSPRLDLTAELRHMWVNPRMNNYIVEKKFYEGMGTISVGLSYKFHIRLPEE